MADHQVEEAHDQDRSLPGFRFHPTDEELVGFYLRRKVEKKRLSIDIIRQIDIYKYDPWDLSKFSTIGIGDKEWYFFCLRGRKYRNSVRPNRVTDSGFWKATGIDKKIFFPGATSNCIGLKKSLVYYIGSAGKGKKTNWMMHEFRLPPKSSTDDPLHSDEAHEAENLTICRIFKRDASPKKSSKQPWMESRTRCYSPTQKHDHGSPNSSCIIDTRDHQFTTSETYHHLDQEIQEHLEVNPSYHADQINQYSEEQWNINSEVCVVGQQNQDFGDQHQWGDFDYSRGYLCSTGFDVPQENSQITRMKYECDDSIWEEIGRILEC